MFPEILAQPIQQVFMGFIGSLHSWYISLIVPDCPSMLNLRKYLDEVVNLQNGIINWRLKVDFGNLLNKYFHNIIEILVAKLLNDDC